MNLLCSKARKTKFILLSVASGLTVKNKKHTHPACFNIVKLEEEHSGINGEIKRLGKTHLSVSFES